jgi:peptidoglycan-associated lipoprotein
MRGTSDMRWKILVTVIAGLALGACETTSDNAGSAQGGGSATGQGLSSGSGGSSSPQVSSLAPGGVPAGSQEDLVTNIGDRVFFGLDGVSLLAEARATLEKQAQWLRRNQGVTITISGHADERGTREYNLALGDRRATAVRDYLVALGLEQNRAKTVSFGKERPVDGRSAEDAWSKNRRSVTTVD